jgi:hypothetical protein
LRAAFCATKARSDRTEHFMKYLMLFALLFMPIPQAHAAQSAQQCLDRIAQFQAYAKNRAPKGLRPNEISAYEDFVTSTITDLK